MDEGERMAVQTEEGERTEVKTTEERWKEAEQRVRYCVRQPRRRREGERRLDRRAFKVTAVCYPTCCSHVMSRMEGMKGRPCPLLSPLAVSLSCLLSLSPSVFFSASVAEAEHSSVVGHLASVAYSK